MLYESTPAFPASRQLSPAPHDPARCDWKDLLLFPSVALRQAFGTSIILSEEALPFEATSEEAARDCSLIQEAGGPWLLRRLGPVAVAGRAVPVEVVAFADGPSWLLPRGLQGSSGAGADAPHG